VSGRLILSKITKDQSDGNIHRLCPESYISFPGKLLGESTECETRPFSGFFQPHRAHLVLRNLGNGVVGRLGRKVGAPFNAMERHEDQALSYPSCQIHPGNHFVLQEWLKQLLGNIGNVYIFTTIAAKIPIRQERMAVLRRWLRTGFSMAAFSNVGIDALYFMMTFFVPYLSKHLERRYRIEGKIVQWTG
jgi:hypothetical protein